MDEREAVMRAVGIIEGLSVDELSQIEGLRIGNPDGPGTPGARWLKANRDWLCETTATLGAFPDPDEDDFDTLDSSELTLPGDREAWQAFAELCLFDSPYIRSTIGERRFLDTDCVRAALEMMADEMFRLLIRRYAPQG
ncbi:hypothetical protein [Micromonospora maritima]|uniref:hypothetical protein n=1 Tax=Micromonospora maritima TaxID=986711 RepID=UPI00157D5FC1|nr:hypothetical protein [Micromonospora maritima]